MNVRRAIAMCMIIILLVGCSPVAPEYTPHKNIEISSINDVGKIYNIEYVVNASSSDRCIVTTTLGYKYLIRFPDLEFLNINSQVIKVEFKSNKGNVNHALVINNIQYTKYTPYDIVLYESIRQSPEILEAVK